MNKPKYLQLLEDISRDIRVHVDVMVSNCRDQLSKNHQLCNTISEFIYDMAGDDEGLSLMVTDELPGDYFDDLTVSIIATALHDLKCSSNQS